MKQSQLQPKPENKIEELATIQNTTEGSQAAPSQPMSSENSEIKTTITKGESENGDEGISIPATEVWTGKSETETNTNENSNISNEKTRKVSFPIHDNELVTGYLEPANPWASSKYLLFFSNLYI